MGMGNQGISVFNSPCFVFFTTKCDSSCKSSMLLKFEQTSMVFSNLVWSLSEHPRKKAPHPMPQGKGLGMGLELALLLEFMAMGFNGDVARFILKILTQPLNLFVMQINKENKGNEVVASKEQHKGKDVVLFSELEDMPMLLDFMRHYTSVSREVNLKTNTVCSWRVTVQLLNDRVTLDHGCATFTVVHHIKIGFMVTFKLLMPDTLKIIVLNGDGIEVVIRCRRHNDAFTVNT
ncbi:Speckle-type POZ protein [Hordeum vulgare]|nr:Speckle-type POZ protein [Hordeum vulgare]